MKNRIALLVATLLLLPLGSYAGPTHLGVDNDDMVQLRLTGGDTACSSSYRGSFRKVGTNGQTANQEFRVPAGKELVITDIVWSLTPDSSFTTQWSGRASELQLRAFIEGGFLGRILDTPLILEPDSGSRVIGGTLNLTGGARVASNRTICLRRSSIGGAGQSTLSTISGIASAEIYGYLVSKQ